METIKVDALHFNAVMDENKRLKKENADLEYRTSCAIAARDMYRLELFDKPVAFWQRVFGRKSL